MVTEITERKRAEERLRQSEERFSKAFHTNPAALAILRASDGSYVDLNEAFTAITGFGREELLVRSAGDLVAPTAGRQDGSSTLCQSAAVYNFETTWVHKSGAPRHVLASVEPIELNHESCLLTTAVDITERKRVEGALRESEERYRSLVEQAADGIFVSDAAGRYIEVNSAGCALFGYRREEILGMNAVDVVAPEEASRFGYESAKFAGGKVVRSEWRFRRKDGSQFTGEVVGRRLADRRIQAIVRDVTERKEKEEGVRKMNAELERRVADRTAQLEAANRELESFSYSVSHDLRAPLRAIDGFSHAVLEECGAQLSADGARYLATVRSETERMGCLIDDLLTFSRLSRAPLERRRIEVEPLVRGAIESLAMECAGRQIDIRVGELPACQGDSSLLRQVWINLLSNAIKYTKRRERAEIEVGFRDGANDAAYFVHDNGAGFDMRYAHKLFGVFQRLHRAEDYEGTGVGLAIVQRIVLRHGGRAWAEGAVDRGATFYFTLEEERPS